MKPWKSSCIPFSKMRGRLKLEYSSAKDCTNSRSARLIPEHSTQKCSNRGMWKAIIEYPRTTVFFTAILCFINSYDGDFVFDDSEAIVRNRDVRGLNGMLDVFYHDFWGTDIRSNLSHKSYRPLTTLSFRFNHWLSGLETQSYHSINIILHATVTVLCYEFFRVVFNQCSTHHSRNIFRKSALVSALIFALHPVHTECVSNVVGRAELLSALFFFLSFLSYDRYLNSTDNRDRYFMLSVISTALATLSKEQGITALGVCVAYDILLHCRFTYKELKSAVQCYIADRNNNNIEMRDKCLLKKELLPLISRILRLCLSTVMIFVIRLWIMRFSAPNFSKPDNPASFHPSVVYRAMNYMYLYSLNLWLLINPSQLCFDYSMGCIPVIQSLFDGRLLVVIGFIAAVFIVGVRLFQMKDLMKFRCLSFALAFTVITFLPSSNLLFRVGFVLAERVLYLPSVGYCIMVALGIQYLAKCAVVVAEPHMSKNEAKMVVRGAFFALLLLFAAKSVSRSNEWRNESSLYASGARVCPANAKVHYNMGKILSDSGNNAEAEQKYREAIRLNPQYPHALNNLGNILREKSQHSEAEIHLLNAVRLRPDFAAAWMNLGIVQTALKRYDKAENAYFEALRHRKPYPDCHFNLGNLYLDQKRLSEALNAWQNATRLKPEHAKAWINQIVLLDQQNDCTRAVTLAEQAFSHVTAEAALHFAVGSCLGKLARFQESERHFLTAIRLDPTSGKFVGNLGVLYHRWERPEQAEIAYTKALRLEPNLKGIRENLAQLRKKMAKSASRQN